MGASPTASPSASSASTGSSSSWGEPRPPMLSAYSSSAAGDTEDNEASGAAARPGPPQAQVAGAAPLLRSSRPAEKRAWAAKEPYELLGCRLCSSSSSAYAASSKSDEPQEEIEAASELSMSPAGSSRCRREEMESSSVATTDEPLPSVSVSRRGAETGHNANGATSTLHFASVCAPRVPCRMRAKPQSFSEKEPPLRKRVQMSVSVCPKVTDRSAPWTVASCEMAVFEPRVHSTDSCDDGIVQPGMKRTLCTVTKYWYLSCSAPRCGRERAAASILDIAAAPAGPPGAGAPAGGRSAARGETKVKQNDCLGPRQEWNIPIFGTIGVGARAPFELARACCVFTANAAAMGNIWGL
eukprot:scaffold3542_cov113-Isochrysis_galbana.AAC.12